MAETDTLAPAPAPADTAPAQAGAEPVVEEAPVGSVEQVLTKLAGEQAPAPPAKEEAVLPPPTEPKYAGKYASDTELERGYKELEAKFTQTSQELAGFRRGVEEGRKTVIADPATTNVAAKYTTDQLETFKEGHLMKMAQHAAAGEQEKAAESAGAIRIIDKELRDRSVQGITRQNDANTAFNELRAEVAPYVEKYQPELVPGNPLYESANAIFQKALRAGAPNSPMTVNSAVILALMKAGRLSSGVEQKARQDLTTSIKQNLEAGVVQGAGTAVQSSSGLPDFTTMTDRQFMEWKQKHVPSWNQ